jgi:hypothetical protein
VLDARDLKYEQTTHLLCFVRHPGIFAAGLSTGPHAFAKIAPVDAVQKLSGAFLVGGRAVVRVRELKRSS